MANMNMISGIIICLAVLPISTFADCGSGQSASFNVNLLTPYGLPNYGSANSDSFNVNLLGIRRAYTDSNSSDFNWFANTSPQPGAIGMCIPVEGGSLKELSGGFWSDAVTVPPAGLTVIIVNHGWNGSAESRLPLATAIRAIAPNAYIYCWNWGENDENVVSLSNPNGKPTLGDFAPLLGCANPNLCVLGTSELVKELAISLTNAHNQGILLGKKLFALGIRPDVHPIHLIGHSFGGVVAANAAKVLYGKTATKVKQITTIDTPALLFPYAISEVDSTTAERVEVIYYSSFVYLPLGAAGGPLLTNATNVLNLSLNPIYYGPVLHSHAIEWYENSVSATDCLGNGYGFGWSTALVESGQGWADSLPLGYKAEQAPEGCLYTVEIINYATQKAAIKFTDNFESAALWFGRGASITIPISGGTSALSLSLPALVSGSAMKAASAPLDGPAAGASDANAAFVYKDVNVPPDAEQLVFDYRFGSVTPGDRIEVAVNGQTELVIDGEVAGVSQTYTMSTPIVVSQHAGQSISLQIALYQGGTEAAEVYINNLRMVAVTLAEDINGDKMISIADLMALAQHWLEDGCDYSGHCSGADISGDGIVNFLDFARLAEAWSNITANILADGVDISDVAYMAQVWLTSDQSADIAPPPSGDGIVNFLDFAELANHWLEGE
jgi:pimeloyl-ACP methyl ester carboxylesterase